MASLTRSTRRNPFAVLGAVCLAALVLPMSFSGGAVATPAIGRALGGNGAELTWITNAFMLTFGSLLMVAGALADNWGRKRVFIAGTGGFALVSLALIVAPTIVTLDLLRALQGVCAAAALAGGTAALAQEFDGSGRARAFSLLGTTFGVGLAFGPIIAGALIDVAGWRAVFATTAAIGTMALAIALPTMPETRTSGARRLDWWGASTFTASLTLFTFGVIEAPASTSRLATIGFFAGALALICFFVRIERREAEAMLDLSLFRFPKFVGVQLLPIATCYSYVVLLVLLPLRFIGIDGDDPLWAGVRMLALSAPMLVVPSIAVWLTGWYSAGIVSAAGLAIAAGGLIWLAACPPAAQASPIPAMLLIGAGAGLPWGLMDGLSIAVVPAERAGMATGIFSTTRVAGEGIALATVAALLTALLQRTLSSTDGAAQTLATGDLRGAAVLAHRAQLELVAVYGGAFAVLAYLLAAVTLVSAAGVFLLLRNVDVRAAATDA